MSGVPHPRLHASRIQRLLRTARDQFARARVVGAIVLALLTLAPERAHAAAPFAFGAQVRYARQPHGGAARARNLGAALATGTLLAFIDADDLWTEHALGALIAPLERDPSLSMTVGLMEQFVSPDLPDGARHGFRFSPDPVPARMCGSVLVRRSEFERVGEFSPRLESGEFTDWILRSEAAGLRFATVPQLVLRRRLHLLNHGVVRKDARQDYLKVVKAALDRRRAATAQEGMA